MFEFIKWLLLVALMAGTVKAANDLDEFDSESVYSWITQGIAFVNICLVVITGLFVFIESDSFPQGISSVMSIAISVEFVYLLFVYGKVIPGYMNSGNVIPKNKETIKIN